MNKVKAILTTLLMMSVMCTTAAADLPATFDWRDVNGTNYITPVKYQGPCGSCGVYAALGIVESNILIAHGIETDLSEQYYVSDCFYPCNCGGGHPCDVLRHVYLSGVGSDECVPQNLDNLSCYKCGCWEADLWYIESYGSASCKTESLKQQIIDYGPICGEVTPGHAAIIVGWNDTTGNWTIKQAGGLGAGSDEGYTYLPYEPRMSNLFYVVGSYQLPTARYDTNNDCHIEMTELAVSIEDWKTGSLKMGDLAILIGHWKSGESYCD